MRNQLRQELGREPTAQDVATHLDEPLEDILEAFLARDAYERESLDAPVRDDAPGATTAHEFLVDERANFNSSEDGVTLAQLSVLLDACQRELLRLRFQEVLTQREIGERIGCSQMHCRASWDTLQRMEASAASGFAR